MSNMKEESRRCLPTKLREMSSRNIKKRNDDDGDDEEKNEKERISRREEEEDDDVNDDENVEIEVNENGDEQTTINDDKQRILKKTTNDFIFGKIIGEGSFSMVCVAKELKTKRIFAIKICEKSLIFKEKKQAAIMREKELMYILNANLSPFIIQLYATFQDAERLYFVMNYAKNGDLLSCISKVGCFNEECAIFYSGELLLAVEHLHRLGIIHRDLKPENILLNEHMHIQVTDFGSATTIQTKRTLHQKLPTTSKQNSNLVNIDSSLEACRKNSFVGTAQYVSPEMLSEKRATPGSDLWAFACILYQMISGLPPFRAPTEYLIFQKITKLEYEFPAGFNVNAKNLIESLLRLNVQERLGIYDCIEQRGYHSIRSHSFFSTLNSHLDNTFSNNVTTSSSPSSYLSSFSSLSLNSKSVAAKTATTPAQETNSNPFTSILTNGTRFDTLHLQKPPAILPYLPEISSSNIAGSEPTLSHHLDDNLEPGFDQKQLTRILGLALSEEREQQKRRQRNVSEISLDEMQERLEKQRRNNPWHRFVGNNLILKQGLIDKRKGLFPRRRMFLLTTGPHFYYVDPVNLVLKGQIPFTAELRTEPKNFKTFFVHTPNRTYYLEDPEGTAPEWCKAIEDVLQAYLPKLVKKSSPTSNKDSCSSKSVDLM